MAYTKSHFGDMSELSSQTLDIPAQNNALQYKELLMSTSHTGTLTQHGFRWKS